MYHFLIRKKIRKIFQDLSHGDFEPSLRQISPRSFEHVFPGNHCLGGKRHKVESMRQWFQRLFRLFPRLEFEIKDILVKGGPWNTLIAIEWVDQGNTIDGHPYQNNGTHVIRIKWGRLISIHAYLDS